MFSKIKHLNQQQRVFLIAAILGLLALIFYLFSGRGSLDQNTRELRNSDPQVQDIISQDGPNGEKDFQVKCQDGSSYDVYYPPGENDYASLSASKCQQ